MQLAVALKKRKKKIPACPRILLYKDDFCHLVEVFAEGCFHQLCVFLVGSFVLTL